MDVYCWMWEFFVVRCRGMLIVGFFLMERGGWCGLVEKVVD